MAANYSTLIKGCPEPWPELKYENWSETVKTIHQWTQIVGKVRLKAMPWQNHSWHSTLYVTARGFSTGSMPYKDGIFEIEFDFESHLVVIHSTFNDHIYIELPGLSVAEFYKKLFKELAAINIHVNIYGRPNELEDNTPFEQNNLNGYNKQHAVNFWQAAVSIHNVFLKFRSDFVGKCSPVHLFWGAFDIAVTRFSGRPAPLHPGGMPNMPLEVMQEAYSQEVSSCGFWPGSDDFPEPIFYSYCYPSPDEFSKSKIYPAESFWNDDLGEYILKYEDVRKADDPVDYLLTFLNSTYEAAAITGGWDRGQLEMGF